MADSPLDRLFRESEERLAGGSPSPASPYGRIDPLEADHFLLRKSWDYFRNRIRAIEDQWSDLIRSKEDRAKALEAELTSLKENMSALSEQNAAHKEIENEVDRLRLADRRENDAEIARLRQRWDEEREALQRQLSAAEGERNAAQAEGRELAAWLKRREQDFDRRLDEALGRSEDQERRIRASAEAWASVEKDQADRIAELSVKVDLLRGEVERRDAFLKAAAEREANVEKDRKEARADADRLRAAMADAEQKGAALVERLAILEEENRRLRADWERERAEWRELWDRARSLSDKRD